MGRVVCIKYFTPIDIVFIVLLSLFTPFLVGIISGVREIGFLGFQSIYDNETGTVTVTCVVSQARIRFIDNFTSEFHYISSRVSSFEECDQYINYGILWLIIIQFLLVFPIVIAAHEYLHILALKRLGIQSRMKLLKIKFIPIGIVIIPNYNSKYIKLYNVILISLAPQILTLMLIALIWLFRGLYIERPMFGGSISPLFAPPLIFHAMGSGGDIYFLIKFLARLRTLALNREIGVMRIDMFKFCYELK